MPASDGSRKGFPDRCVSISFPQPEWFLALGRLMKAEGELFHRLGFAEVRFGIRVLSDDEDQRTTAMTGVEINGYDVSNAIALDQAVGSFDPDFVICAKNEIWNRMLDEIHRTGRPELRRTLSSLALVGEDLWLESDDQLREDKFYRYNQ